MKNKKTLFLDTNALLDLQKYAFTEFFYMSFESLRELETLKSRDINADVAVKAQKITRLLMENEDKYQVIRLKDYKIIDHMGLSKNKTDSIILATVAELGEDVVLVTGDLSMMNLARANGLSVVYTYDLDFLTSIDVYRGYRALHFTNAQMARFYENLDDNHYGCKENEYLLIYNRKNELVDKRVWRHGEFRSVEVIPVKDTPMGDVKPRNVLQELSFEMLRNPNITIKTITGPFGTGKDYIMLAHALKAIDKGKFSKLVWVRNNVNVKDTRDIGYLPGSSDEKMLPWAMPIADQLGGLEPLEQMIEDGVIELQPLAFIRGRSYNNAIIYCSEAENLTLKQVQLILGRVGENSQVWLNGDYRQSDSPVFTYDNGLTKMVERLAGDPHFGYVRLETCERSETARLADMLD